jgi:hypothetical protein
LLANKRALKDEDFGPYHLERTGFPA